MMGIPLDKAFGWFMSVALEESAYPHRHCTKVAA